MTGELTLTIDRQKSQDGDALISTVSKVRWEDWEMKSLVRLKEQHKLFKVSEEMVRGR